MKRLKRGEIEWRQGEGKVLVPLFLLWNAVSGKQSSPVLIIHQSVHITASTFLLSHLCVRFWTNSNRDFNSIPACSINSH